MERADMFRRRKIGRARGLRVPIVVTAAAIGMLGASCPAYGQVNTVQPLGVSVGPQYDTTHVYVEPGTENAFVKSWEATFGGTNTTPALADVTPTPSEALSTVVLSPVGSLSVFDFRSGIPYPYGEERGGDLVSDFNEGVADAVRSGASVVVSPYHDAIGRDCIVQFPGGVDINLYWHTTAPSYPRLASVPESRVYLGPGPANSFIRDWLAFSGGHIVTDDRHADGAQIGMPGTTYRAVLMTSGFGQTLVIITDGHLPYPFGRDTTGYAVSSLAATLAKAKSAGARILWGPYYGPALATAIVQFPGGYVAEIHQA
jgi:hypothetical protein